MCKSRCSDWQEEEVADAVMRLGVQLLSRLGSRLERRARARQRQGAHHGEAGPCGHRRTEWSVGRQDAMIPMAVTARGRDEHTAIRSSHSKG